MDALGELLGILHGTGGGPLSSVRAEFARSRDKHRARMAFDAFNANRRKRGGGDAVLLGWVPETVERDEGWIEVDDIHVWHEAPSSWRVEEERNGSAETRLKINVGESWWSWSRREGARSNESGEITSRADSVLELVMEPWPVAGTLTFEVIGDVVVAQRAAIAVTAHPRDWSEGRRGTTRGLPLGADEYRMAVDRERGVLLRLMALLKGEPFFCIEMSEVEFDIPLGDDVFAFSLPDGRS